MRLALALLFVIVWLQFQVHAQSNDMCLSSPELKQLRDDNRQTLESFKYEDVKKQTAALPALMRGESNRGAVLQKCLDKRDIFDEIVGSNCGSEKFSYNAAKGQLDRAMTYVQTMNELIIAQLRINRGLFRSCRH